jgi:hypothetical protein
MALESRELLIDDVKIYSNGLINALKQDKFVEARGYLSDLRNSLEPVSKYVEAQISFAERTYPDATDPVQMARLDGDDAVAAAKRAEAKAERLERLAREAEDEAKRLKRASRKAKKEAAKASKAAKPKRANGRYSLKLLTWQSTRGKPTRQRDTPRHLLFFQT